MTRALTRLALAAVAVAVAVYLIPASVQIVAWPAGGPVRVALLAPLSRLWWALAASVLLCGVLTFAWRRSGADVDRLAAGVTPLSLLVLWLVPFLPWLPDRAPLLLVLAGPLRWVILAAALSWGLARLRPRLTLPRFALGRSVVFVASLVLYVSLGLRFTSAAGFGGDEPHYLVITHSLLVDHDLDIANNHERRDYRAFFPGDLRPDYLQRAQHGEIYSIHAPGLPALLVPAYAAGGASGAIVAMAILAALTALAVFDTAVLLAGPHTATLVWAAVCLTVPFLPHAWLIYPELPGALVVAWSVLWIREPDASSRRTFVHGVLLACLPWLHTKFVVFLALLAAWQCLRLRPRVKQLAVLLAPIAMSVAAWLYFFHRTYGTLDPEAPYGSSTKLNVLAQNIPHGILGLLFDQKFGLFVYSPIYVLALAGLVMMWRDARLRAFAAGLTLVGAAFLLSTTRFYMWWGGSSAPARFLVPVVPLLAPGIAVAVDRLRGVAGRAAVFVLLLASLGIAAVCLAPPRAGYLFSDPHGVAGLVQAMQGSAPLDASLPTFTEEHWHAPLVLLLMWLSAIGVGAAVTAVAVRSTLARSSWAAAATAILAAGATAGVLVGGRAVTSRARVAARGQLELMHAYDAARLRPLDLERLRRLSVPELFSALTVAVRRDPDSASGGLFDDPFELPEGEYEARVWFGGDRPHAGEIRASLSEHIMVARTAGPLGNPSVVRFRMAVPARLRIGLTDGAAAAAARLVEIAPLQLAAGAARSGLTVTALEPVEGRPESYMAYADEHTYPEGGVFWTRGTETGHLVLVPARATELRLILHVGPNNGRVAVEVANRHLDIDMAANETREVVLPLPPGALTVAMSVRASRAFRPAEADPASDDQRRLGCQVRPRLN